MEEILKDLAEEVYHKHYVTVDERGLIVNGFSDAFREPSDTDICINEHGGYHFTLFPDGEVNPPLYDYDFMIPLYKYEADKAIRRPQEEIDADIAALPVPEHIPTAEERISNLESENAFLKAQIDAQSEQMDFYEDCIAEMAMVVYA